MAHGKLEYNHIVDGIYVGTNQCCQMHFEEELLTKDISADISLEKDKLDMPFGVEFYVWLPVEDHHAPTDAQLEFGVATLEKLVALGKRIYVHCKNGHGRAPTLLAAYLIKKGKTVKEAISFLKLQRPLTHLTEEQKSALQKLARKLTKKR